MTWDEVCRILRLSTPFSLFSDKAGGYRQRHDPFFAGVLRPLKKSVAECSTVSLHHARC